MQLKTLKELHDLYLSFDVNLLADIWIEFEKVMSSKYENLYPSNYYTLPGYSWDAMLKITKVKIELIDEN